MKLLKYTEKTDEKRRKEKNKADFSRQRVGSDVLCALDINLHTLVSIEKGFLVLLKI